MCKCVEAGAKPLTGKSVTVGKGTARRTFNGAPTDLCEQCGDFELAVAVDLARNGPVTGATFRYMHELLKNRIGLSGTILADLLGRTPEAISRWKDGAQKLDPLAWTVLGAMVVEYSEGRDDTLYRLGMTKGLPAAIPAPIPSSVEISPLRRPTLDLRAQHDAKRREIVEAIAPMHIAALRNRTTAEPRDLEGQRVELKDRLVAIDARFGDVVDKILAMVEEDKVRANGLPETAARLAWEAKLEDPERKHGARWGPAVRGRVVKHYRRVLQQSPAARAVDMERFRALVRRTRADNGP
jgi:hypothetical protein